MRNKSNSRPSAQENDFLCPITLDIYQDPVLATDGYVYERSAIIRWIDQQGTSPLTREPLNVEDLRSEYHIRKICQFYQSHSVNYSSQNGTVSISSVPITQIETNVNQSKSCKQYCNLKHVLLTIFGVTLIFIPIVIAAIVITLISQTASLSNIAAAAPAYPNNYARLWTIYKLPNSCTFSNVRTLFSWNNVPRFTYTYYSKMYKSVSNQIILTFAFRHDSSYWCLDDVSFIDISSKIELMKNGNFENDVSNGFLYCNSYENRSIPFVLDSTHTHNGKYSFCDGSVGLPKYLSQRFDTKIGQLYHLSFWLQNLADLPNSAQVVISY